MTNKTEISDAKDKRIEQLEDAYLQLKDAADKLAEALKFYGGVMLVSFAPNDDGGERARTTLAAWNKP